MRPLPARTYLMLAALLWPSAALAQQPATLPSGGQLQAIVATLSHHARAATLTAQTTIERCTLLGDTLRCTCIVDDAGWTISSLAVASDGALLITDASGRGEAGERWSIHALALRADSWEMQQLLWTPAGSPPTLQIERLTQREQGGQLDAEGLSWHATQPERADEPARCGPVSPPTSDAMLLATGATWRGEWLLRDARASWLELKGESRADSRRDGLLPPIMRADAAGFEYSHSLGFEALPFLPGVLLSPRRWYGIEATFLPSSATQRPLAASAVWAHDGGLAASLFGQAVLGDVQTSHLSVDAERTTGPDAIRQLRRIEQGTWLRSWQAARLGLGLSSSSLMLNGVVSADRAPWALDSHVFGAALGDTIQTSAQSSVEAHVEHWTATGAAQAAQHHSAMMMGWSRRWGSPGKIEGSAGILGAMSLDTTDGGEQWRAATTGALAAYARTQLHIVGRFEGSSHHLLPHAALLLSPAGIDSAQQGSVKLGLDQRLISHDGAWGIELPLGLFLDWRADRESGSRRLPYAALRAHARSAAWETRLSAALLCVEACDTLYGVGQLHLIERRSGLGLVARAGYADVTTSLSLSQLGAAQSAMFSAEAQRQLINRTLTTPSGVRGLGLSWRGGHHRLSAELWESASVRGASGGYGFVLPAVGWGLSLMGAWADDGRWSTWLGLSI